MRGRDRKSTRLNSSHLGISYAVFCLKKKKRTQRRRTDNQSSPETVANHRKGTTRGRERPRGVSVPHQPVARPLLLVVFFFFFNDTAPTEIYPLSLHDALPI